MGQALEVMTDVLGIGERGQALGAGQQLARGLRAAQQQQAEQRDLLVGQAEGLAGEVLVALGARGELLARQARDSSARSACCTAPACRFMTGSRAVFWLAAETAALTVSG